MFDISFPELVLIAIVGLLVIGPKRLPEALRALGLWIGRMRRSFNNVKNEIEKEIGMDEIRRQLHNEAVMEEMKRIEREVRDSVNTTGSHAEAHDQRQAPAGIGTSGTHADAAQPPEHDPAQEAAARSDATPPEEASTAEDASTGAASTGEASRPQREDQRPGPDTADQRRG